MYTREEFINDIAEIINKHSVENDSNTPDFILAEYMVDCLDSFVKGSKQREKWFRERLTIGGN